MLLHARRRADSYTMPGFWISGELQTMESATISVCLYSSLLFFVMLSMLGSRDSDTPMVTVSELVRTFRKSLALFFAATLYRSPICWTNSGS